MNRRLLGIIVLILGVASVGAMALAQRPGQSEPIGATPESGANACHPVAVLDLVRIFNECAQIKDLNEKIRQKTDELTKEAGQRHEVIKDKEVELSAFKFGVPDYDIRRKELMRLNVEANVWLKMEEGELEREKFHWTRIIYEQAVSAAADVAKERGCDVVLQRTEFKPLAPEIDQNVQILKRMLQERIVVYHVPEIDITDVVIRRLDAAYRAGGGKKQLGDWKDEG